MKNDNSVTLIVRASSMKGGVVVILAVETETQPKADYRDDARAIFDFLVEYLPVATFTALGANIMLRTIRESWNIETELPQTTKHIDDFTHKED